MNITLLPGFSRVRLEGLCDAETSGIVLPERMKAQRVFIGRIIDSRLTRKDEAHIGVSDINGLRVLLANHVGRPLSDTESIFPNLYPLDEKRKRWASPFLAFLSDDAKLNIAPLGDGDKRCRFCGPADARKSQNNVMLTPHPKHGWYCPRCRKNESGDKVNPEDLV